VLANGDRDGIPNVLVEAMACALPVVTTPVSGIPELVRDGENGLLVPPDDPDALAAAILRLRGDAALRRRLGEAARATVRERFDGDRLAGELVALFREAVA
jgi:glycosyltransferase involved in cell wall biosynthesis